MPRLILPVAVILAMVGAQGQSQVVVPATPKKFTKRSVGDSSSFNGNAAGLAPAAKPTTVRVVSYFSLSEPRQWINTEGKSLLGSLIAFEESVVETIGTGAAAAAAAPAPIMPKKPTVVRDGKARLLMNGKPYEVPLDKLSEADRKFVEGIRDAIAAKP